MIKLICKDCGFRFNAEKEKIKKCPYCAGDKIEKEKSAEELVDDIKKSLCVLLGF